MAKRRVRYQVNTSPAQKPATPAEQSSVYARGQTVIPKAVREALSIEYGTRLHWEVHEGVIQVIPIPQHPVQALRGILKGTGITYASFMQERQRERQLERQQERQWEQEQRPSKLKRGRGSS
jgi:bifunctional DNA-binding transcriptional regulator/antitoxin component of YhaV-PrlF toxin-antitoxin module